jgi:hypothetical protein
MIIYRYYALTISNDYMPNRLAIGESLKQVVLPKV